MRDEPDRGGCRSPSHTAPQCGQSAGGTSTMHSGCGCKPRSRSGKSLRFREWRGETFGLEPCRGSLASLENAYNTPVRRPDQSYVHRSLDRPLGQRRCRCWNPENPFRSRTAGDLTIDCDTQ